MEKTKTIEVFIIALKVTGEDEWMLEHIKKTGGSIYEYPAYTYYRGDDTLLKEWLKDYASYRMGQLDTIMKHLKEFGQLEPIRIYKDMRICSGHKRASALASLGKETIKAIIVPDDTKL